LPRTGSDRQADAVPFIEFMLGALRDAFHEAVAADQATDQVAALISVTG